ncbi:MAG: hypothetical protein A2X36_02545 [Elusimicrobia bacterium GWA2_69_24]|nr:MAG: hypothetical protein A2W08_03710 [Candidatus Rokubacteria bacterium RBG_16_73_20]OGR60921.1 MAG: hypothetical protein A2X36_02545 [Elusimicrobia bacterium GWA2_69_24]
MARWALFAYHTFGARALAALLDRGEEVRVVVTHPDDPDEGGWFESVAALARVHGVPVLAEPEPDAPAVLDAVRRAAADVLLAVWYRRLLPSALLALPRVAALNLHGSLLPAYRGRAPVNWALVNGERLTGVTLHHMTAEADAGDIVAQRPVDIALEDTAPALYDKLVTAGVDLLLETYPAVLAGTAPRVPQDHTRATHYPRRRPEDGRVAWTWPAARIADMVRAVTHPWPGAFVGDGAARLHLWAASVAPGRAAGAPAGTLLALCPGEGVTVATGAGVLLLRRVQAARACEEPADAWARRCGLAPGARLAEGA